MIPGGLILGSMDSSRSAEQDHFSFQSPASAPQPPHSSFRAPASSLLIVTKPFEGHSPLARLKLDRQRGSSTACFFFLFYFLFLKKILKNAFCLGAGDPAVGKCASDMFRIMIAKPWLSGAELC